MIPCRKRKYLAALLIMAISPGCLTLLYSQTLVRCGIATVDFWWTSSTSDWGFFTLNVTSNQQIAQKVISGQRLVISSFNTSGRIVSIEVISELNGTLLNYSRVSGESLEGVAFPSGEPTNWVNEQEYTVAVHWEGTNASVRVDYHTENLMHADGTVCHTLPGFHGTRVLGFILLGTGLIGFILFLVIQRERSK